jgi:hypothetical protein
MENVKPLNKGFSQKDIKEIIERINKNLEQIKNDFSVLVSLLIKEEKKEQKKIEGYKSFTFIEPIPKNSGLEGFLLNRILNKESAKHGIEYILNKDKNEQIIQLFVRGEETHIKHIFNACEWINKKLKLNKEKEVKTVPNELL